MLLGELGFVGIFMGGGIFAGEDMGIHFRGATSQEELQYAFDAALGDNYPAAEPDPHAYELEYEPRLKLEIKRGPLGGGCG